MPRNRADSAWHQNMQDMEDSVNLVYYFYLLPKIAPLAREILHYCQQRKNKSDLDVHFFKSRTQTSEDETRKLLYVFLRIQMQFAGPLGYIFPSLVP
jgi:hypothetical protein